MSQPPSLLVPDPLNSGPELEGDEDDGVDEDEDGDDDEDDDGGPDDELSGFGQQRRERCPVGMSHLD